MCYTIYILYIYIYIYIYIGICTHAHYPIYCYIVCIKCYIYIHTILYNNVLYILQGKNIDTDYIIHNTCVYIYTYNILHAYTYIPILNDVYGTMLYYAV